MAASYRVSMTIDMVKVNFLLPSGSNLAFDVNPFLKVKDIKELLYEKVNESVSLSLTQRPEECVFLTPGKKEPIDEFTVFKSNKYIKDQLELQKMGSGLQNKTMTLNLVEKKSLISKEEKMIALTIGSLIGRPLKYYDDHPSSEVHDFRRAMVVLRYEAIQNRPELFDVLPVIDKSALPKDISKHKSILFNCHMDNNKVQRTLKVSLDDKPDAVIERLKQYYQMQLQRSLNVKEPILKVCGETTYFTGDEKMIEYTCVREELKKQGKLNVMLVEKEELLVSETVAEQPEVVEEGQFEEQITTHESICLKESNWQDMSLISLWDMNRKFRLRVLGVEQIPTKYVNSVSLCWVETSLICGGVVLTSKQVTPAVSLNSFGSARWEVWNTFDIECHDLPRPVRLCCTIYGKIMTKSDNKSQKKKKDKKKGDMSDIQEGELKEKETVPIGWANFLVFDHEGYMLSGRFVRRLWPDEIANEIGTCTQNPDTDAPVIHFELDSFTLPVIFPRYDGQKIPDFKLAPAANEAELEVVHEVVKRDPIAEISENEQHLMWCYRHHFLSVPEGLPKFWRSIKLGDRKQVMEASDLVKSWAKMSPVSALELLDANFSHAVIREYSVGCLEDLSDVELEDYLSQLVQVLKYEPYHDNKLIRFLIMRALQTKRAGHMFFWYLKAEMENPEIYERFGLYLEAFLRGAGSHRIELHNQTRLLSRLVSVAEGVKATKTEKRKEYLQNTIAKIEFPKRVQLILNPKVEIKGLVSNKCKYFDSKKLPLFIPFINADPSVEDTLAVMFKCGDDLRQDMLTIQMIYIMDRIWKDNGLDLCLSPYPVLATGNEQGFLQIVTRSETVAKIQMDYGGLRATLKEDPITDWLRSKNPDIDAFEAAVQVFTKSCAGYCMATYVLGIGDRHNDNIMVRTTGELFHIDFGHFLGHIKKKLGVKRERAPFVLTPDFLHVMCNSTTPGGKRDPEKYEAFIQLCVKAYQVLRTHSNLFISLFAMMLSTGIPELKTVKDIQYLRQSLAVGKNDKEGEEWIRSIIDEAVSKSLSTQLNWLAHNIAHR